jgi:cytochrome c biogenesis protein CcmG, thiol:disulfide interchange protein DsbE
MTPVSSAVPSAALSAGSSAGSSAASRRDLRRLPRGWLLTAAVVPVLLLAAWGGVALSSAPSGARIGAVAPDFALVDLDGNPVRLADLRGRPVIVNFWASWCVPCVEEFPLLREVATDHAADGLVVVGIVYQDRSEAARDFMARFGADWPAAMDPGGEVAAQYGIYGPPESFFVDRHGVVTARQIGGLTMADLDDKLAAIIDEE